jgi:hypothetical protein
MCFWERSFFSAEEVPSTDICKHKFLGIKLKPEYFILCHPVYESLGEKQKAMLLQIERAAVSYFGQPTSYGPF